MSHRKQTPVHLVKLDERICLYCRDLPKCSNLMGLKGQLDITKVVTPKALWECKDWGPVTWRTRNVRDSLYARGGSSSLRGLFILPDATAGMLKGEEEYEMTDTPDLASIIRDGMSEEDRRGQLRYVTDEDGYVILDDDEKPTPRPSYEIRNFAISKEYHIGLNLDTGLFWRESQVMDYIIKEELEQELISNNGSNTKKPKRAAKAAKPQRETSKMGKKVIRRGAGKKTGKKKVSKKTSKRGASSSDESKTIRPRRSGAPKKTGRKSAARATEDAPEVDLSEIEEKLSSLQEQLEELKAGGGGGGEGDGVALDVVTNMIGIVTDTLTNVCENLNDALEVLGTLADEFQLDGGGDEEEEEGEEGDDYED